MVRHPRFAGPAIQTLVAVDDCSDLANVSIARGGLICSRDSKVLLAIMVKKAGLLAGRCVGRYFGRIVHKSWPRPTIS